MRNGAVDDCSIDWLSWSCLWLVMQLKGQGMRGGAGGNLHREVGDMGVLEWRKRAIGWKGRGR